MIVRPSLCTRGGFLYGGAGLGAAISALEQASARQVVWATAQFLSYARPGEELEVDVTLAVEGHQTTQARAVCQVADREVLTVNAALGERDIELCGQWETMPTVLAPELCIARAHPENSRGTINDQIEERLVKGRRFRDLDGTPSDGQTVMWARVPAAGPVDATTLAILGDHVPWGVRQALGMQGTSRSLDNTLRINRLVPTDWVLLDIRVHVVGRGFGHGLVHMFAQDGTLLATASQSCVVRPPTSSQSRPAGDGKAEQ